MVKRIRYLRSALLVNSTSASLTQPTGIETQPISIAHTRNTVHQEQSIVSSVGIYSTDCAGSSTAAPYCDEYKRNN